MLTQHTTGISTDSCKLLQKWVGIIYLLNDVSTERHRPFSRGNLSVGTFCFNLISSKILPKNCGEVKVLV